MIYYKDPESGQIFAYEEDDLENVLSHLVKLTKKEVNELMRKKEYEEESGREMTWVAVEMSIVAEQLLMHEDDDDMAISTPEAWREYRKALRRWNDTNENWPSSEHRPVRPE